MITLRKGEIGVVLEFETNLDLTNFNTISIQVKKPSGEIVTWPASISSNSSTRAKYVTNGDDFDESGFYLIHVIADSDPDVHRIGNLCRIRVLDLFETTL